MRRLLTATSALAIVLAGCGGGGFSGLAPGASGSFGNAPGPHATATPVTTPAPDPHPVVDGAAVTFVNDSTTTDTLAGQQPTTKNSSFTETATIHTGATFNGHAAFDVHSASTDGTFVRDNYEAFVPTQAGQNYVLLGQTVTDSTASDSQNFIDSDPIIVDELPEISGAQWSNSDAGTFSESRGPATNHVDTTQTRRVDGSAVTSQTTTDGNPADTLTDTFTQNADGSGGATHQGPPGNNQLSIGVPVLQNGVFVIPETFTDQTGTQTYTVPDWYPGGGLPPPDNSDLGVDLGVTLPEPACSKGPQLPAAHIRRSVSSLDVLGSFDVHSEDAYFAPGRGLICVVDRDTIQFYDYTNTGALQETVKSQNVAALQSGIGITSKKRSTSSAASYVVPIGPLLPHRLVIPRRARRH